MLRKIHLSLKNTAITLSTPILGSSTLHAYKEGERENHILKISSQPTLQFISQPTAQQSNSTVYFPRKKKRKKKKISLYNHPRKRTSNRANKTKRPELANYMSVSKR